MLDYSILLANSGSAAPFAFVATALIVLAILGRLFAGSADRERIERYLRDRGCEPLGIEWSPFGRGAWGERNDRVYFVRYRDADGYSREAWCKTSRWGGVFVSDNDIPPVRRSPAATQVSALKLAQLERENQKLREELERLNRDRDVKWL